MRLHVAKLRLADRLLLTFLATVVASWAIGGVSAAGAVTLRTAGDSAVFVTENDTLALRAKVGTYPTEDHAPPGTHPPPLRCPGARSLRGSVLPQTPQPKPVRDCCMDR